MMTEEEIMSIHRLIFWDIHTDQDMQRINMGNTLPTFFQQWEKRQRNPVNLRCVFNELILKMYWLFSLVRF